MDYEKILEKVDCFLLENKWASRLDPLDRFFEERNKVGLDIGTDSVKMIQVMETPQGPELMAWGIKKIAGEGTKKEEEIVEAIRELWDEKKIKTKRVRAVICDPAVYLRHITIPVVPEDDLVKAVKWQAEKHIPFSIDNAIVDFQILKSKTRAAEKQMEIVIAAAETSLVEKYVNIIKGAKLIPTILDLAPFAAAWALIRNYQFDQGEIIPLVDIGDKMTSIVVVKDEDLQLVRSIEFGTRAHAEALLQSEGLATAESPAQGLPGDMDITPGMESFLSELVEQLNRSLAYCEREFVNEKIRRLYLCGSGARIKNIELFLTKKMGLKAEIVNPLMKIQIPPDGLDTSGLAEASAQMTAAAGEVL